MVVGNLRERARARVVSSARIVAATYGITADFSKLVQDQAGLTRASFLELFPTQNSLLTALHLSLADETIERLRQGAEQVEIPAGLPVDEAVRAVVAALLRHNPMDRSAAVVRNRYRLIAMENPEIATTYLASNEPFVRAFSTLIEATMASAGLVLGISKVALANVVSVWTERAFEEWLIAGHDEHGFAASPFASDTLPSLVRAFVSRVPS
ncbi:hypothetical protein BH11ACT2_BH11ACT2_15850 [soil metagenome]